MSALIDLAGKKFGRLIVLYRTGTAKGNRPLWACRCDCGGKLITSGSNLRAGKTASCGCIHRDQLVKRNTTHGLSRKYPGEYKIWKDMKARCNNQKNKHWKDYGGRGIVVSAKWTNDFATFLSDMGPRPVGLTIDRIDNDGNYEPGNCRWATVYQQARNRRSNTLITHNGKTRTQAEWARLAGIGRSTLAYRLGKGWSFERAMSDADGRCRSKNAGSVRISI